ncbi:MAG: single-stranded DNA-binding protein, partial [Salinivirgaceae bacterium]|nr:single-stranded DNA-binding protein [Salinivirgaceae bacterium]
MSVNKVFILGHVGKDPNIKHFETNSVASFSMATSEKYKDRNGTLQERTDWHNIVVNGKMAKVVEDYVKKGTQMMVEGKIRTRKYEVNGQDRYITEIYAERFELLGRPQNSSESKINTPQDTHQMDSGNEPD